MCRLVFTSASAASLLLSVATAVQWSRSPVDLVRSTRWGHWIYLGIYGGNIRCDVYSAEPQLHERFGPARSWGAWRVRLRYEKGMSRVNAAVRAQVPVALLIGVTAILPVTWWVVIYRRRHRREKWAAEERCLMCGYDLRATPGRCPECGTPVAPRPATVA